MQLDYDSLRSFFEQFDSGAYGSQRLGQAFCNSFLSYPCPELFYQVDRKKAEAKIWDLVSSQKG